MFGFICGVFSAIGQIIKTIVVDKFLAIISGPIVITSSFFI
jgi:hypothetical protein